MRKIKIINMLRKIRIIVFLLPLSLTILFNSCATEDEVGNEEAKEKSLVITNINLEKLKTESLSIYQSSDFSALFDPNSIDINYEKILEILNQYQGEENINYENILGVYYHEEYFSQLFDLLQFSKTIIQSDLFDEKSTIEERETYLVEIMNYVFLSESKHSNLAKNNCTVAYNACENQAVDDHRIRLISCTATATVASLATGGAGALYWPICMVTSGYLYDSAMTGCSDARGICRQQQ